MLKRIPILEFLYGLASKIVVPHKDSLSEVFLISNIISRIH